MANDIDKVIGAKDLPPLPTEENSEEYWDKIIKNNPNLVKNINHQAIDNNPITFNDNMPVVSISLIACCLILVAFTYSLKNMLLRRFSAYASIWILGVASFLWVFDISLGSDAETNSILKIALIPPLFFIISTLILRFAHDKK